MVELNLLYYQTLFWVPKLLTLNAALLLFAWIVQALRAHWQYSVKGSTTSPLNVHLKFFFLMAMLLILYVPVTHPARFVGLPHLDQDLPVETTTGVFLVERAASLLEGVLVELFVFDVGARAQRNQTEQVVEGSHGSTTIPAPTDGDILFSLMWQRGQFLGQAEYLMKEKKNKTVGIANVLNPFGDFDLNYFLLILGSAGMWLMSFVLFGVAVVVKVGPIFVFAIGCFMFGFSTVVNATRGLAILLHSVLTMLLVKQVLFIILYVGFFLIEAATFQGWVAAAKDTDIVLVDVPETFEPGFLYTPAGMEIMKAVDQKLEKPSLLDTMAIIFGTLLAVFYFGFKSPSLIARYLGDVNQMEDILMNTFITTSALAYRAVAFLPKASKANTNQIST